MKNAAIPFISFIAYFLLSTSAIVFFVGLIIYGEKFAGMLKGALMIYSIAGFVIGMTILISTWTSWKLGAGLLIFFILLAVSIKFSNNNTALGRLAGFGMPLSVFFLIGWIFWFAVGSDQADNKNLLKNGISAPAVILSCERTGVTMKVNTDYPHYGVKLEVEVKPKNEKSFVSVAEDMLAEHEIAEIKKGMHITVRYIPDKKDKVAVESW